VSPACYPSAPIAAEAELSVAALLAGDAAELGQAPVASRTAGTISLAQRASDSAAGVSSVPR